MTELGDLIESQAQKHKPTNGQPLEDGESSTPAMFPLRLDVFMGVNPGKQPRLTLLSTGRGNGANLFVQSPARNVEELIHESRLVTTITLDHWRSLGSALIAIGQRIVEATDGAGGLKADPDVNELWKNTTWR